MKIAYITAQVPWGCGEAFILEELLEMKRRDVRLLVIPRNPGIRVFHKAARELLENSIWLRIANFRIAIVCFKALLTSALLWRILETLITCSRNLFMLLKNLVVFPKAVFVADLLKRKKIGHIHAHWGSTTSTMAYIISELTGIPWSLTLHRWDIKENNMLKEKVASAKFVRCISKHGKNELLILVGKQYNDKIKIIHAGVKIPEYTVLMPEQKLRIRQYFTIITPANLLQVKGHKHLIEACSILVNQNIKNFQCIFYGEGHLKQELQWLVAKEGLNDYVQFAGVIPHERLIKMYREQQVDIVILPSIITEQGEHEGIPVSLMEAMSYGIPVISTNTGGIPELLSGGAGIIVDEKSAQQLADAIIKLMTDLRYSTETSKKGWLRIVEEFDIKKICQSLSSLIQNSYSRVFVGR